MGNERLCHILQTIVETLTNGGCDGFRLLKWDTLRFKLCHLGFSPNFNLKLAWSSPAPSASKEPLPNKSRSASSASSRPAFLPPSPNHIPVLRTVGGGGDTEPERDEPEAEAVAGVVLIREGSAEHVLEEVGRPTGERGNGSGGTADPRQGQLPGSAGQVHRRGGVRHHQGGLYVQNYSYSTKKPRGSRSSCVQVSVTHRVAAESSLRFFLSVDLYFFLCIKTHK